MVTINFRVDHNQFIYKIKDNGDGFDPLGKKLGHGLSSMKKRAADLQAEFTIDTKIGEGTAIRLCIKLP